MVIINGVSVRGSLIINEAKWLMPGWAVNSRCNMQVSVSAGDIRACTAEAWPCFRVLSRALPAFACPLIIVFIRQLVHKARQSKFTPRGINAPRVASRCRHHGMWQVRWLYTSVYRNRISLWIATSLSLSLSLKPGYCYWPPLLLTVLAFLRGWSMNVAGISVWYYVVM